MLLLLPVKCNISLSWNCNSQVIFRSFIMSAETLFISRLIRLDILYNIWYLIQWICPCPKKTLHKWGTWSITDVCKCCLMSIKVARFLRTRGANHEGKIARSTLCESTVCDFATLERKLFPQNSRRIYLNAVAPVPTSSPKCNKE